MSIEMDDKNTHEHGEEGEHGGHAHTVTVIVNARPKQVSSKDLTFDQVVALAYDVPPTGDNVLFTVTYRKGDGHKPAGSLVKGEKVKVKEGMVFNVRATDKS